MKGKKKRDPDEPSPLNFNRDESKGPRAVFENEEDLRGDNEEEQYYEEEEALSPEERKLRKEEGDL